MSASPRAKLDIGELLAAVENAAPVAAADVVGELLADALGAREVAFLIAEYSGEALVRLSHATAAGAASREIAERVRITDSAHGRALADQTVEVEEQSQGWRLIAPVTNRGEAIGVLELILTEE